MNEISEILYEIKAYVEDMILSLQEGRDSIACYIERLKGLCKIISQLNSVVSEEIMEEYKEYIDTFVNFCNLCNNQDFIVENVDELLCSLDVLNECIEEISKEYKARLKKCVCCGNTVVFSRIHSANREKRMNSNMSRETEKEEYVCPRCGSSDKERMLVTYLKKNKLISASETTRMLYINPTKSVESWINSECPQVKYETRLIEGVITENDVKGRCNIADDTYDIIICTNSFIQEKEESTGVNELYRILKDDGQLLCVIEEEMHFKAKSDDYGEKTSIDRIGEVFVINEVDDEILQECGPKDICRLCVLTKKTLYNFSFEEDRSVSQELLENGPLVTVILPCYNHERFVADAIESVINQTYKNIEFLVGDDGSTDSTPQIMKKYSKYFDKAIYCEKNTKCAYWGRLLDEAHGKYVALMHSDDVWKLDKLAKQVAYLEEHEECGVCLSWCRYTDENLNEYEGHSIFIQPNRTNEEWMRFFWKNGNALCNPSSLIRREIYKLCGKFGGTGRQLPDFFKWIDYIQMTDIYIYPEVLINMRRYNCGYSENTSSMSYDNLARHMVEEAMGWLSVIRDMPKEFFANTFREFFVKQDASTDEEIMCEKMFLMLNDSRKLIQYDGLLYYTEIFSEVANTLYYTYDYKNANFQRDETEKGITGMMLDVLKGGCS